MTHFDHTAITIDVDPRQRRMRGRTAHHDLRFDVPYISQIAPDLWMGGCADGLELPAEIDHVVSLYPWESYDLHDGVQSVTAVWMYDEEGSIVAPSSHVRGRRALLAPWRPRRTKPLRMT